MKAIFDRQALLQSVQIAASIIPARTPKVILQNVKLCVSKTKVVVKATDLESVGVTIDVRGVQIEEPGDILLPSGRAVSILKECQEEELRIEGDEDGTSIRGGFSEFDLPGENAEEYPTVKGFEGEKYHSMPSRKLKEMVKKTILAVATESARFALTGVLWELNENKVRLVATDGKRMAVVDGTGEVHGGHGTGSDSRVVPTRVMHLLEKNLADTDDPVLVSISSNDVLFKTGKAEIYGRLVEGRYPTYRDVFPKRTCCKIPLLVGSLTTVVRQAGILTDDDSYGVDFQFAKGMLTLQSRVPEKGRSKVQMPIAYDGKTLATCFDPRLVLEFLRVLEPDTEVMLELVENNTVSLWTAPGDYSYIVVPIARVAK